MVDVKQAIRAAVQRVQELFADAGSVRDIRLEEVNSNDDGGWMITVSFPNDGMASATDVETRVGESTSPWRPTVIGIDSRRAYKQVAVNKDGEVTSIQIRPIVVR